MSVEAIPTPQHNLSSHHNLDPDLGYPPFPTLQIPQLPPAPQLQLPPLPKIPQDVPPAQQPEQEQDTPQDADAADPVEESSYDPSEPIYSLPPPPQRAYPSRETLVEAAQTHAAEHGYAVSINNTWKSQQRVKVACVCYGKPKNTHKLSEETRVRKNRTSHKTGCRMWVEGRRREEDGLWWLTVKESRHNHPGREVGAFAVHRKSTWDSGRVKEVIDEEVARGTKAKKLLEILEEKCPGVRITKRDIYNQTAQARRGGLRQQTPKEERARANAQKRAASRAKNKQNAANSSTTDTASSAAEGGMSALDPELLAQCNTAVSNAELERLRAEIQRLQNENSRLSSENDRLFRTNQEYVQAEELRRHIQMVQSHSGHHMIS
ncbi:hypothetical protein M501DRAFT_1027981 [Patellaria atrata CBS 101060]|uniref:FAR1 domain-containing protein n=1 Tax=Patellaria atrata CBS 101060 TaxID=1346257 RepID=A0A9P4VTH7_9PEZI|nr:hypothetical protein M501DRAFT_1027981 [Patellaria atrata CBS 101060]